MVEKHKTKTNQIKQKQINIHRSMIQRKGKEETRVQGLGYMARLQ